MSDCECCHGEAPFLIDHGGPDLQERVPCPLCGLGEDDLVQQFDPEHPERGWTQSEPLSPTPEPPVWRWWVHNLIAHPLLILCPPLGEWLHGRTSP